MKRINNKGLTVIEILVCFSIVSVIIVGMLKTINNYSNNATLTSYKNDITTYKDTTTKYIMDKIIDNGGVLKSDFDTVIIEGNNVKLILENGNILRIEIKNEKIKTVYKDYKNGTKEEKNFKIPEIDDLGINPIKIEKYENFIDIYADFYLSDFGHTYSVLDLKIPVVDKNDDELLKLKNNITGRITSVLDSFDEAYIYKQSAPGYSNLYCISENDVGCSGSYVQIHISDTKDSITINDETIDIKPNTFAIDPHDNGMLEELTINLSNNFNVSKIKQIRS